MLPNHECSGNSLLFYTNSSLSVARHRTRLSLGGTLCSPEARGGAELQDPVPAIHPLGENRSQEDKAVKEKHIPRLQETYEHFFYKQEADSLSPTSLVSAAKTEIL